MFISNKIPKIPKFSENQRNPNMASSMKSQPRTHLLVFLLLAAATLSVSAARPCKTLLISSYSFSLRRLPNPSPSGVGFVTVLTEVTQTRPLILIDEESFDSDQFSVPSSAAETSFPSFWPYDLSSLRDRTKDILSVVVALLFGVGCGALTAATMYLAWSLFADPRHGGDDDDDYYDGFASDEDFSPKKVGYVKIPAAVVAVSAKEDVESAKKAGEV